MTAPNRDHGRLRGKIVSTCTAKNRYSDQATAVAMGMQQESIYEGTRLFHYRCSICRGWHITHYERSPSGARNLRCSPDIFDRKARR